MLPVRTWKHPMAVQRESIGRFFASLSAGGDARDPSIKLHLK